MMLMTACCFNYCVGNLNNNMSLVKIMDLLPKKSWVIIEKFMRYLSKNVKPY